MRVARLVGLSPDGRFVIVATERGEELAIAADDRLRAALRGDRPRLGQLEIEMESALSPREIQTRIRSGESVDDVARVAGIDRERVERFAAPVIAEREHVAGLALTSSARRRGETSSHRTLRGVLTERLLNRGVDIHTVRWDSYRLDDGRWAVTADYLSGESPRQALFYFDVPGRYSVAGNDEGRWVLGDTSPARGPQPGRRPPVAGESDDDTEPTLDLSDELALVRAIQDSPAASSVGSESAYEVGGADADSTMAEVVQLNRGSETTSDETTSDETTSDVQAEKAADKPEPGTEAESDAAVAEWDEWAEDDEMVADEPGDKALADKPDEESGLEALDEIFRDQDPAEVALSAPAADATEVLEVSRPSDASAVPELSASLRSDAWEPAIVVDYPVEPSEDFDDVDGIEVPEGSDDPGRPEAPVAGDDRRDEATALEEVPLFDEPAPDLEPAPAPQTAASEPPPVEPTAQSIAEPEDQPLPLDVPEQPTAPPTPRPARRKRASVPSWDEIVFGGPKDK